MLRYVAHVESAPDERDGPAELLLDRIDSLRIVLADSEAERDALLLEVAGAGKVEREMAGQMATAEVLAHPGRFEEAHRLFVRGLEVLERNGARSPQIAHLGPLRPVAQWIVQQAIRFITRSYLNDLARTVCGLYQRREAASAWGSPERSMLRRSRVDMQRVRAGLSGRALGLPTFIFGGAVLTTLGSGVQNAMRVARGSTAGIAVAAVILVLVLVALSWAALYSAGVARRRIAIAVEQPLAALWETVGAAGRPPRDGSQNFAVYAIILLVLSWIVVPLGIWMAAASV